jgi:hypothetical protein
MAGRMVKEFGSGDNDELRSEARERRKVINWAFVSSVSSLLFPSPYFVISFDLSPE